MSILDDLLVPAPPYRMARPVGILATNEEDIAEIRKKFEEAGKKYKKPAKPEGQYAVRSELEKQLLQDYYAAIPNAQLLLRSSDANDQAAGHKLREFISQTARSLGLEQPDLDVTISIPKFEPVPPSVDTDATIAAPVESASDDTEYFFTPEDKAVSGMRTNPPLDWEVPESNIIRGLRTPVGGTPVTPVTPESPAASAAPIHPAEPVHVPKVEEMKNPKAPTQEDIDELWRDFRNTDPESKESKEIWNKITDSTLMLESLENEKQENTVPASPVVTPIEPVEAPKPPAPAAAAPVEPPVAPKPTSGESTSRPKTSKGDEDVLEILREGQKGAPKTEQKPSPPDEDVLEILRDGQSEAKPGKKPETPAPKIKPDVFKPFGSPKDERAFYEKKLSEARKSDNKEDVEMYEKIVNKYKATATATTFRSDFRILLAAEGAPQDSHINAFKQKEADEERERNFPDDDARKAQMEAESNSVYGEAEAEDDKRTERATQEKLALEHEEDRQRSIDQKQEEANMIHENASAEVDQSGRRTPDRRSFSPISAAKEAVGWIFTKPGSKTGFLPYIDSINPRLDSFVHRKGAEIRMAQQNSAQKSLERAEDKRDKWQDKRDDARFYPLHLFDAWRAREWQRDVDRRSKDVAKFDVLRKAAQERHNGLQRKVAERFEEEAVPYRNIATDLKEQHDACTVSRGKLSEFLAEANKKKSAIDSAKWKGGRMTQAARAEARELTVEIRDLETRIRNTDGEIAAIIGPLTRAQVQLDKWQSKISEVSELMAFPETEGLKSKPIMLKPTPGHQNPVGSAQTAGATPSRPGQPSTPEAQLLSEHWPVEEFVKQWNDFRLLPKFDDQGFKKFVEARRIVEGIDEKDKLTLEQMLKFADLHVGSNASTKREFHRNRTFFIKHSTKPK